MGQDSQNVLSEVSNPDGRECEDYVLLKFRHRDIWQMGTNFFLIRSLHLLGRSLNLTKEAKCSAATLLFMHKATCCHHREVHNRNKHRYENRKSFGFNAYLAHYSTMYHLTSRKRNSKSIYTECAKRSCAQVYEGGCTVLEMGTLYRPISRYCAVCCCSI